MGGGEMVEEIRAELEKISPEIVVQRTIEQLIDINIEAQRADTYLVLIKAAATRIFVNDEYEKRKAALEDLEKYTEMLEEIIGVIIATSDVEGDVECSQPCEYCVRLPVCWIGVTKERERR